MNDYALKEAAFLVNRLLAHRDDVRQAMIASDSRMCILGYNEFTTDLPEFSRQEAARGFEQFSAKDYWDARARGTGMMQRRVETAPQSTARHADTEDIGEFEEKLQTAALETIPVEKRLRGLPAEERLRGLSPEEVLPQRSQSSVGISGNASKSGHQPSPISRRATCFACLRTSDTAS